MKNIEKFDDLARKARSFIPSNDKFLAYGQQHDIFELNNNWVIKIPKDLTLAPVISSDESEKDIKVIDEYFHQYMPETFVIDSDKFKYVVIQQKIDKAKNLQLSRIIKHIKIRNQFNDVVRLNDIIIKKHNLSLDFFGHHGLMSTLKGLAIFSKKYFMLSNIIEGKDEKLYIVDTNLTYLGPIAKNRSGLRRAIIDKFSFWLNKILLRICFKI